ncbi:MAG: hypothetical protein RLZZ303_1732 [Candidatus Hydrogenedentota bacterium]|jgi:hypothetical protein
MLLLDAFNDIIALVESLLINIPVNNVLGTVYVVLNLIIQIGSIFLGGEVDLPSSQF